MKKIIVLMLTAIIFFSASLTVEADTAKNFKTNYERGLIQNTLISNHNAP